MAHGPLATACPSVDAESLRRGPDGQLRLHELAAGRREPVVVRRAFAGGAAVREWSFEELARRCDAAAAAGAGGPQLAQSGLIEQGTTAAPRAVQPAAYLRALAAAESTATAAPGLLPPDSAAAAAAASGEHVPLDWASVSAARAAPDKQYLAHWDMFAYLPQCRAEGTALAAATWPRATLSWDFAWAGPAGTVTGLHYDRPNNWFTQARTHAGSSLGLS